MGVCAAAVKAEVQLVVEKMAESCTEMSPGSGSIFSTYMPKRFEEDREHQRFFYFKCPPSSSTGRRISSTGRKNIRTKKIRHIVSSTEGGSSRKVGKSTNTVISNLPT